MSISRGLAKVHRLNRKLRIQAMSSGEKKPNPLAPVL